MSLLFHSSSENYSEQELTVFRGDSAELVLWKLLADNISENIRYRSQGAYSLQVGIRRVLLDETNLKVLRREVERSNE